MGQTTFNIDLFLIYAEVDTDNISPSSISKQYNRYSWENQLVSTQEQKKSLLIHWVFNDWIRRQPKVSREIL